MVDPTSVVTGAAIVAAAVSEAGKKLVTPVAEQLGLALGDLAGIYRFYQNQNLGKIFTTWGEARGEKPSLTEEEIRRILPLLPLASVQADEDLQRRWATLLEYTIASPSDSLPSFGQTLSQLTPEEARFLDRFMAWISERNPQATQFDPVRGKSVTLSTLIRIYDPTINAFHDLTINIGMSSDHRRAFESQFTPEQLASFAKLDQAELLVQDLERLGILVQEQVPEADGGYVTIPRRLGNFIVDSSISGKKVALHRSEMSFRTLFALSPYGVRFIRAVTPKQTQ